MQYLYLIKCNISDADSRHKIGVASDVGSRLAQLQTGSPFELTIENCYIFENAAIAERAIHQAWSRERTRGEWFLLSGNVIGRFQEICSLLGGIPFVPESPVVTETEVEEAEEEIEYTASLEDVKRIMADSSYRHEYRFIANGGGVRGITWRLRSGNREAALYVGRANPIFNQVLKMLEDE